MIKFYNTLTRKKEEFVPIDDKEVRIYSCGPTVYYYAHIGNLRAYLFMDTLRRVLKYNGYKLKHVMNITDVGHLVSDADEGEDKMLKAAKREHKDPFEIAKFYTEAFMHDLDLLNIGEVLELIYLLLTLSLSTTLLLKPIIFLYLSNRGKTIRLVDLSKPIIQLIISSSSNPRSYRYSITWSSSYKSRWYLQVNL